MLGLLVLVVTANPFQPTWYDENYSTFMFVNGGLEKILTDYHLPNNHILYNLVRSTWRDFTGDSVLLERG